MSADVSTPSTVARAVARLKSLIPIRRRLALLRAAEIVRAKLGWWKVRCSVCGGRFRSFLPAGLHVRQNARCPGCGALERHRLQWLFLEQGTDLSACRGRVLHIAPEECLSKRISTLKGARYVTADIARDGVDVLSDLTRLGFRDGCFDIIICSHVLEHIADDGAALTEIRRVLSPRGWALLQVPLDERRQHTFEDHSINDPLTRERMFGQWDHVRVYGQDYPQRLKKAGFDVQENRFAYDLDSRLIVRYGLVPEPLFLCCKTASAPEPMTTSVLNPPRAAPGTCISGENESRTGVPPSPARSN